MLPIFLSFTLAAVDLVFINGTVITVDKANPAAQAFAVDNGKFAAVGSSAEIRKLATKNTRVVDLKGKTVTPGFNDAHLHPRPVYPEDSPYFIPWLGPDKVRTMNDLIAALKKKAAATPAGQLVGGAGYQDTKLGRHPTRFDLDQVSTKHPVSIAHSSGHIGVVNSYILDKFDLKKSTPDPPGGSFDRDSNGELTGVVRESARRMVSLPEPAVPAAAHIEGLVRCFRDYTARGITSINVAGASPGQWKLYEAAQKAGAALRIGVMLSESHLDEGLRDNYKTGKGNDNLRWTALKMFQGNSLSGRTCWLTEEYSDRPGYFGIPPARSQADFDRVVQRAHNAGYQLAVHANGDREIDMVLTAFDRAQRANPRPDARHRIEHASICTLALLQRAKDLNVIMVFHSYMWEHGDKLDAYGAKRIAMMHPYRSAIDMGVRVAGHSDAPVSAANPLLRIQDMVTRMSENGRVYGANQKTTVNEAIEVFTLSGAYSTFEDDKKGSIAQGKLADFVILAADPRESDPLRIKDIRVEATYIGGKLAR